SALRERGDDLSRLVERIYKLVGVVETPSSTSAYTTASSCCRGPTSRSTFASGATRPGAGPAFTSGSACPNTPCPGSACSAAGCTPGVPPAAPGAAPAATMLRIRQGKQ